MSNQHLKNWTQLLTHDIGTFYEIILNHLNSQGEMTISPQAKIDPTAVLVGSIQVGEEIVITSGAILRGDFGKVIFGQQVTISENIVLHAGDPESVRTGRSFTLTIEDRSPSAGMKY
jgi:carbonic anhydrase/acetyltransferase-like protein (isoleucine patch superfamily)